MKSKGTYQLKREQQLNCSLEEAWDFFTSPYNLEKITPKEMDFVVLSDLGDAKIRKGMLIDYTVRPLLGIKTKWTTEITEVDELKSFVDFQAKGPYKLWNHFHHFEKNEQGVLMTDVVDYQLPLGILGKLAHGIIVKKKLERIFDYRFEVLQNKFNKN